MPLCMWCEAFACVRAVSVIVAGYSWMVAVASSARSFSFSSLSSPIGQASFRSCQPIAGILMADSHYSYQHLACHQSQGTWCKPLRTVSLSSLRTCSQKHCERPYLTGSVTKRTTPKRKESTQSLHTGLDGVLHHFYGGSSAL